MQVVSVARRLFSALLVAGLVLVSTVSNAGAGSRIPPSVEEKKENTLMYLRGVITPQSVAPLLVHMDKLAEENDPRTVELIINSPGGSVIAGLFFVSRMRALKGLGYEINCQVLDVAASMAFQILTECDNRAVLGTSLVLWHPVRIMANGPLTAAVAKQVAEDLGLLDEFVLDQLDRTLTDLDSADIRKHFLVETLWTGFALATRAPAFAVRVNEANDLVGRMGDAVVSGNSSIFDLFRSMNGPTPVYVWTEYNK